jgi:hypothetical protein
VEGDSAPESRPESKSGKITFTLDKEKFLTFIENLIDILTLKRVGLIAILSIVGLLLFSLYENRVGIVERITQPVAVEEETVNANWALSENSKTSLIRLAQSTAVSFVVITDADLKKNRKLVKFWNIDDPTIKLTQAQEQALTIPQAVFDYDAKNTAQMVSILSNEFRCDLFKDTVYNRIAPDLADKLPTICRIAIPPFVGQFAGFMTLGIDRQMSKQELDSIRLEASRIAVEIYLTDVIKKPAR